MDIFYKDDDMIVINKPPGIAVHGGVSVSGITVADMLLAQFPEIAFVRDALAPSEEAALRPGIMHRLDKDTSGVMVIARTQIAFDALKKLFQSRLVTKTYRAIVCGAPKERSGIIAFPIGRMVKNPLKRGVAQGKTEVRGAREAVTEYRVLQAGVRYSLVELMPKTGRMHQLRVHMKALGHPIACDTVYGCTHVCCPSGASRQMLHAFSLSFSYPTGVKRYFETDPPEDFLLAIKEVL